ncbi:MAG: helix-turn-helix transcriptional regulator [Rectinemataceae bacterium]
MARTVFFIEALLVLAASALLSLRAALSPLGFALPPAIAILVPFFACMAVWPPGAVLRAIGQAFSSSHPSLRGRESLGILRALSGFIGLGAAAGALMALIVLADDAKGGRPEALPFQLLAFLLFSALYAQIALILCRVVEGALLVPASAKGRDLAQRFGLSPREAEVASGLLAGKSYRQIGGELFISEKTVKTHASHIYEKTGCPNRLALVLLLHAEEGIPEENALDSSQRPMVESAARGDVKNSDAASAAGGRP